VTRGRAVRGRIVRLSAFGTAAAATVALTQVPVSGAFSAVSGNAANSVSSAASFCTATSTTLYSTGDTWTDAADPADNNQNDPELTVRASTSGDRYVWTAFALPAVPARCELSQARLRYYNKDPDSGTNVDVYRGDPTVLPLWTAATLTWSNQPAYLGPAATNAATTSTAGWQEWVVTDHVVAQYRDGNNGFVLRDRKATSTYYQQIYYDRQHTTFTPTLVLTWG
jgi:large repetitive protein